MRLFAVTFHRHEVKMRDVARQWEARFPDGTSARGISMAEALGNLMMVGRQVTMEVLCRCGRVYTPTRAADSGLCRNCRATMEKPN